MSPQRLFAPPISSGQLLRSLARCQRRVHLLLSSLVLLATIAAESVASAALQSSPAANQARPLRLQYVVRMQRPATHLAEIEIDARHVESPTITFAMPAWSPGRYAIYDFAKNVQEFEAKSGEGQALEWGQPDKQTWTVQTAGASEVRVMYKVYGNDLSGSFSQIDSTHANLNGASVFMYVEGHKPDPIHLTVDAPADWKLASGYSLDPNQRSFDAANYDRLIDTPLEVCPALTISSFTDRGKTFAVVVHDYATDADQRAALVKKLVDGLKRIVDAEMAMMPAPDFDHYTFLFHFAPDISAGDGMEHLNSTQIVVSQFLSDAAFDEAYTDAAHEFFHLWNVKRLRPAALGPFDYSRESYSPSLWFAEGVTSYYSYVAQLRAGLWSPQEFLKHLSGEIEQFETQPGRKLMSAESSSLHAWFYDRSPQMQETNFANSTISYYNKGAILGMLFDLEIRSRSGGSKSLDDVMRMLYQRLYGAPQTSYYLPGRGYEENDLVRAMNGVSGSDLSDFFRHAVQETTTLPYTEVLSLAGLSLQVSADPDSGPNLGAITRPATTGLQLTAVTPGGAADRAGLGRDDLLVSVDNFSLATSSLEDRLKIYPPGAEVLFVVQRHAERAIVTVKLDPPLKNKYVLVEESGATPKQVELRKSWLGH